MISLLFFLFSLVATSAKHLDASGTEGVLPVNEATHLMTFVADCNIDSFSKLFQEYVPGLSKSERTQLVAKLEHMAIDLREKKYVHLRFRVSDCSTYPMFILKMGALLSSITSIISVGSMVLPHTINLQLSDHSETITISDSVFVGARKAIVPSLMFTMLGWYMVHYKSGISKQIHGEIAALDLIIAYLTNQKTLLDETGDIDVL